MCRNLIKKGIPHSALAVMLLGVVSAVRADEEAAKPSPALMEKRILLSPDMVLNESGWGDAGLLVDEQELAGEPAMGEGGKPVRFWHAESTDWHYPASAVIDLGARHHVTRIFVYDSEDSGSLKVGLGTPFKWRTVIEDSLGNYQKWNEHKVGAETRYLQVALGTPASRAPEIVVYGVAREEPVARPVPNPHVQPTMDQFVGINAFIDDPMARMEVAGFVREYHSWQWNEGDAVDGYPGFPKNQNMFNPAAAGGGAWFFDTYYGLLKERGILVCPAIQGTVRWLVDDPSRCEFSDKPVRDGKDPLDPASYAAHADHLFQYAARYGATPVADALLKLAPDQPRKTGLGLLKYIENWNEQDRWWGGRSGYFSAYEYAAMASADCDGHGGTMGKTFGVKNADPNMKLVMAGTAGLSLDYIRSIKFWSEYHRKGSIPFDVINVHHYCNTGGGQRQGQAGISPEDDRLKERLRAIVDYRNREMPGKEVWISEFGYDTNPKSPQHAPSIGRKSIEHVQADWLIRSYLALAAAGVDRAIMYMLRDVNPESATQFNSSGLVGPKDSWKPKPSWFYLYTLKNRLAGMRFASEIPSGRDDVFVYHFKREQPPIGAYAIWCPSSDGSAVKDFKLNLGDAVTATQVEFAGGKTNGVSAPLNIVDGVVTVDVSEKPLLVIAGDATLVAE